MYRDDVRQIIQEICLGNSAEAIKLLCEKNYIYNPFENNESLVLFLINQPISEKEKILSYFLEERSDVATTETFSSENPVINDFFNAYWKNKMPTKCPLFYHLIPHLNEKQILNLIEKTHIYSLAEGKDKKEFFIEFIAKFIKTNNPAIIGKIKEDYWGCQDLLNQKNKSLKHKTSLEYCEEKIKKDFTYIKMYSTITGYNINNLYDNFIIDLAEQKDGKYHKELSNEAIATYKKFLCTEFKEIKDERTRELIIARTLACIDNTDLFKFAIKQAGYKSLDEYKPKHIPAWSEASKFNTPEDKNETEEKTKLFKMFIDSGTNIYEKHPKEIRTFIEEIYSSGIYFGDKIIETLYKPSKKCQQDVFLTFENNGNPYTVFQMLSKGDTFGYLTKNIYNYSPENINPSLVNSCFTVNSYNELTEQEKIQFLEECLEKTWLSPIYEDKENTYSNKNPHLETFFYSLYGFDETPKVITEYINLTINQPNQKYQERFFKLIENYINHYGFQYLEENTTTYKGIISIIEYFASNPNLPWQQLIDYTFLGKQYTENEKEKKRDFPENKKNFNTGGTAIYSYLNKIALSHTLDKKEDNTKRMKI